MLKKRRTITGCILRDIERQLALASDAAFAELLPKDRQLLAQHPKGKGKGKLYTLHALEVECVNEGKARQPYEFGVKVGAGGFPKNLTMSMPWKNS